MRVFLDLPGLNGAGNVPGLANAFELTDFDFGVARFDDEGGPDGNSLSAIGLSLGQFSFDTMQLLRVANAGTEFGSATIRVMAERDGDLIEVERLTLDGVRVALVTTEDGSEPRVALSYDRITIRSKGFNPDGTPNAKLDGVVSYDITDTPTTGNPVNLLTQPSTGSFQPDLSADPQQFLFAKIDGIKGDSENEAFKEHFELAGAELDLQRLLSPADATSGRLAPVSLDFGTSAPASLDLLKQLIAKIELTYVFDGPGTVGNAPAIKVTMSDVRVFSIERLDGNQTRVTFAFDSLSITADAKDGSSFAPITASNLIERFDPGLPINNGLPYDTDTQAPAGDSAFSYRLEVFDGAFPRTHPANDSLTDSIDPAGMMARGFEFDLSRGIVRGDSLSLEGFAIDLPGLGVEGRQFWSQLGTDIGNLRFVLRDATGKVTGYFELTDATVAAFSQQPGFADRLVLSYSKLQEFKLVTTETGDKFVSVFEIDPREFDFGRNGTFDTSDLGAQRPDDAADFTGYFISNLVPGSSETAGFEEALEAKSFSLSAAPTEMGDGSVRLSQFTLDFAAGDPDVQRLILATSGSKGLAEASFFLTIPGPGGDTVYSAWKFTDLLLTSVIDGSGMIRLGFRFSSVQMVDNGLEGATKGFEFPAPTDDLLTIGDQPGGGSIEFDTDAPMRPISVADDAGPIRLQIDGLTGGATDADLAAPFTVLAYHYRFDRGVDDQGDPSGVLTYTPLVVDFAPGQSGLTGLLAALASGDPLPAAILHDYRPGADPGAIEANDTRREISLSDLTVLSYSETGDGSVRVVFAPGSLTLTERIDGNMVAQVQATFDEGGSDEGGSQVMLTDGSFDAGPPAAFERSTRAFLDFNQKDVIGGSVVSGFENQYEAHTFSLDLTGIATGDAAALNVVLPNDGPGLTRLLNHTRNGEGFPTLKLSLAVPAGPDGLVTYQIVTLYNVFLGQVLRGVETTTVSFTATLADVEIATLGEDGFIDLGGPGAFGDPAPGFSEVILDAGTNDVVRGTSSNDQLNGGAGDDDLSGGEGRDALLGGAGNDVLRGSDLVDSMDGGDGSDTLDMSGYDGPQGLSIDLAAGSVNSAGTSRALAFVDIENAVGSRRDDTITGTTGDNVIEGGAGADVMDGGEGTNTLSYKGSLVGVFVDLDAQIAGLGDAEGDSFVNFSHVEGSAQDDDLSGDDGRNRLYGGAGNDVLTGNGDFDFLFGGAGNDRLRAGIDEPDFSGGEIYRGGDGFDTMVFYGNGGFLNAIYRASFAEIEALEFGTAVHGGGGRYHFTATQFDSIELIRAGGRAGGNANRVEITILSDGITAIDLSTVDVRGFGAADRFAISGLEGVKNTIIGSSARDAIFGQNLSDLLVGGKGRDNLNGFGGRDRLQGGFGNDKLRGGNGNDMVFGEDGNDIVQGGRGADTVGGGLGTDVLTGNGGVDTFRFISFAAMGGDVIRDFGPGETLDFRNAGVAGFGTFDGTAGMLRFRTQGGNGFVEADIDGDGNADFSLSLNGVGAFDAGSLVF